MHDFFLPGIDAPMVVHPDGTRHGSQLGRAPVDAFDSRTFTPWPRIKGRDAMDLLYATRRREWIVRGSGLMPLTSAICDQGGLFTGDCLAVPGFANIGFFRKFIEGERPYTKRAGLPRITERSLVIFLGDEPNYYHFVADVMPNIARAANAVDGLQIEQIVVYGRKPEGGFRRAFLDLLLAQLSVPVRYESGPFVVESGHFILHTPHGYARDPDDGSILKLPQPRPYPFGIAEGMWDFFDAFDRGHVSLPEAPVRAPILIVSRAHLKNRKIVNEDALVERLAPLGAERVILENYSLPEQIAMVRASRVLVGCHGAGMINGGFLGQGGRVIEITARQYAARSRDFARLSHVRPIRYSFILADEHGDRFQMTSNLGNNIIMSPQALAMAHEWASQTLAAKAA